MQFVVILALLVTFLAQAALAAPPTTCNLEGDYERALCAYQRRNFGEAETAFRRIAERGEKDAQTIRSLYFLARTPMKTGRYDQASALPIRNYALDPAVFQAWEGGFPIRECREGVGEVGK